MRSSAICLLTVAALVAPATAQPFGWCEMASVPPEPSDSPVGNGSWLAASPAKGLLYAQKGDRTTDFYCYDPMAGSTGTWTALPGMPYATHPLWDEYPPWTGSRGCSNEGDYIYVVQGCSTLGFWGFGATDTVWTICPDVKLGMYRKKIDAGTDMTMVVHGDTTYIYLLKGGSHEFYRFNIMSVVWQSLLMAPVGDDSTWDEGSFITHDQGRYIYAHMGDVHEFYRFDLDSMAWTAQLSPMPYIGRRGLRVKLGRGGGGRWMDGYIYALKGENSQEFWRYDPGGDTWTELDTIPSFGSTGQQKNVNGGGHLACMAGAVYALKGNETTEFWRYRPSVGVDEKRPAAHSRPPTATVCRGSLVLPRTLEPSTPWTLFSITGRKVMELQAGQNDISRLSPGVYILRSAECGERSAVTKVVVQR